MTQKSKTGETLKVTWEKAVMQFENLVKFAARQQVENRATDTMLSAEDLYQEGMIKLYDCWVKWCVGKNKDMNEFSLIFKKSLFRAIRKGTTTKPVNVDLEEVVNTIEDTNGEDTIERMYREFGLKHLSDMLLSNIAKEILGELIEPSPKTLYEVWADQKRREMLKSQGKKINVPKDTTVRMKHIIRALHITNKQYDIAMTEIREKAKIALADIY